MEGFGWREFVILFSIGSFVLLWAGGLYWLFRSARAKHRNVGLWTALYVVGSALWGLGAIVVMVAYVFTEPMKPGIDKPER
ncbi:MAG: hypothetical protein ACR2J8_00375 [Thermomicrobiales bacterium]